MLAPHPPIRAHPQTWMLAGVSRIIRVMRLFVSTPTRLIHLKGSEGYLGYSWPRPHLNREMYLRMYSKTTDTHWAKVRTSTIHTSKHVHCKRSKQKKTNQKHTYTCGLGIARRRTLLHRVDVDQQRDRHGIFARGCLLRVGVVLRQRGQHAFETRLCGVVHIVPTHTEQTNTHTPCTITHTSTRSTRQGECISLHERHIGGEFRRQNQFKGRNAKSNLETYGRGISFLCVGLLKSVIHVCRSVKPHISNTLHFGMFKHICSRPAYLK